MLNELYTAGIARDDVLSGRSGYGVLEFTNVALGFDEEGGELSLETVKCKVGKRISQNTSLLSRFTMDRAFAREKTWCSVHSCSCSCGVSVLGQTNLKLEVGFASVTNGIHCHVFVG